MRWWVLLLCAGCASLPSTPREYVAPRGTPVVDGRLGDAVWAKAPWTDDFVDIADGPVPRFRTRAKMAWDDTYLYIAADMEEPHLQASFTERDSYIFHRDNDFEVFIDPDGDTHLYFEFEMNALNTMWDLMLVRPYRDGGPALDNWDCKGLVHAVHLHGTLNDPRDTDRGWSVEIAIPWKSLKQGSGRKVPPRPGDQWWINFSRVQWRYAVEDGKYVQLKKRGEDNWVWSPQGKVSMHMPERWGIVQFCGGAFVPREDAEARALLRRVYYEQKKRKKQGRPYATKEDVDFRTTGSRYEARAGGLTIDETGRIR